MQTVTWELKVDWARNGVWVDESDRLSSASGSMMAAAPGEALTGGAGMADSVSITLLDPDRRYDPGNGLSPLAAALAGGRSFQAPFYLAVSVEEPLTPTSLRRIITGAVRVPRVVSATSRRLGVAELSWLSRMDLLRAAAISTVVRENYTEAANIQYALEQAGFVDGDDFVSQVKWLAVRDDAGWLAAHPLVEGPTIEPAMHTVPAFWLDDEPPFGDLSDLAAACLGSFTCNRNGLFGYENVASWYFRQTPVLNLTRSTWQDYETSYLDEDLWQRVVVEMMSLAALDEGVIWESEEVPVLAAGESKTITAAYRQPATSVRAPVSGTDFTAITAGGAKIGDVHVTMVAYGQRAELTLTNSHAWRQAYVVGLQLRGVALDSRPGQQVIETSSDAFWTGRQATRRPISGVYVQTYPQASMIAKLVRDRHQLPLQVHVVRGIQGLPQLRVGDLVAIDPDAVGGILTSGRRLAHVVEIGWRLGASGFWQDLTCVDREGLFAADTEYFVLGTHRLGSVGADRGRMFY